MTTHNSRNPRRHTAASVLSAGSWLKPPNDHPTTKWIQSLSEMVWGLSRQRLLISIGPSGWEIRRQLPPLAAGPEQVEDRVEHGAHVRRSWPAPGLRRWNVGNKQRPLWIRQVRRVPPSPHARLHAVAFSSDLTSADPDPTLCTRPLTAAYSKAPAWPASRPFAATYGSGATVRRSTFPWGNEIAAPNAPTATTCCCHRWNVTALPDGA